MMNIDQLYSECESCKNLTLAKSRITASIVSAEFYCPVKKLVKHMLSPCKVDIKSMCDAYSPMKIKRNNYDVHEII